VLAGQLAAADAAVGGLDVEDDRVGNDDGAMAGAGGPPAEVDVVAVDGQPFVESELLQQRAA